MVDSEGTKHGAPDTEGTRHDAPDLEGTENSEGVKVTTKTRSGRDGGGLFASSDGEVSVLKF